MQKDGLNAQLGPCLVCRSKSISKRTTTGILEQGRGFTDFI